MSVLIPCPSWLEDRTILFWLKENIYDYCLDDAFRSSAQCDLISKLYLNFIKFNYYLYFPNNDGYIFAYYLKIYKGKPEEFSWWEIPYGDIIHCNIAHKLAAHGIIFSKDFKYWDITDKDGSSVAHTAVICGTLPEGFDKWELADKEGWTVAHEAARFNSLPKDFNKWELANKKGKTVAHIAVWRRYLPKNFNEWELSNKYGWTVAHEAARAGHLPKDFDKWELATKTGWTVAHVAAFYKHLPKDFKKWYLANKAGRTVAETALKAGYSPKYFDFFGCG